MSILIDTSVCPYPANCALCTWKLSYWLKEHKDLTLGIGKGLLYYTFFFFWWGVGVFFFFFFAISLGRSRGIWRFPG